MKPQEPMDPTPIVGAQTDVAPLGPVRPPHERTADEEVTLADWNRIAGMEEFRQLLARKLRFILPATIFFLVYYFALPVLVGFCPQIMEQRIGPVNLAYLFALSQFFMAWGMAGLYVAVAAGWDKAAEQI